MTPDLIQLKLLLKKNIATAKEALAISQDNKKVIDDLKCETELTKKPMLKSNKVQGKLDDTLVKQEIYSRKKNLIFTSFDVIHFECEVIVFLYYAYSIN